MGAETFTSQAAGKTALEAFATAVIEASYEYGHGGYTGSIAEKNAFKELRTMSQNDADYVTEAFFNGEGHQEFEDKWGAAGCIHIEGTDEYLFFGWASS